MTSGIKAAARRVKHYAFGQEPGDKATKAGTMTVAEVQELLLWHLRASGPLHKWSLRDRTGINEGRILKELQALRAQKRVKLVGTALATRAWAVAEPVPATAKLRQFLEGAPTQPRGRLPRPLAERYPEIFK